VEERWLNKPTNHANAHIHVNATATAGPVRNITVKMGHRQTAEKPVMKKARKGKNKL
jgi:hypothetical protein